MVITLTSHVRHNISNHHQLHCLFNRLFGRTPKAHQSPALLAFCDENSPMTGKFPSQRVGIAEIVSISWHHDYIIKSTKRFTWLVYPHSSHYNDVIMSVMASQITSLTIVYSTVYSGADQRKHQSSAPLVFVRGIHWWPVNSPHKGPVTWKMFPFDDVIMRNDPLALDIDFPIPYK